MHKTPTALLTAWGAVALAAFVVAQDNRVLDDPRPTVAKRVQLWQPVAAERRFDEIGWAADILQARRLAREHNRPVFLFTHDGHMAVGRC
jgi:hypothetical protein